MSAHAVYVPDHFATDMIEGFARGLLSDVQDLVGMHLHEPWPLTADGRPTHAWAASDGTSIEFGFRVAGGSESSIRLPSFRIDAGPGTIVPAG